MAGISFSPACIAARNRRSPATTWYRSGAVGCARTRIGCKTPWTRIDSARLSSSAASKSVLGWNGLGSIWSIGTALIEVLRSALGRIATSPSRAANPRPSLGGVFLLDIGLDLVRHHDLLFLDDLRAEGSVGLRA